MALTTVQVQITWNTNKHAPDLNQALDILINWEDVELVLMNQERQIVGARRAARERFREPSALSVLEQLADDFSEAQARGWADSEPQAKKVTPAKRTGV